MVSRSEMQCREKWVNVLDPLLQRTSFLPHEDALLLEEVAKYTSIGHADERDRCVLSGN